MLELTKREYRGLALIEGLDDAEVITIGREDINPLRLNPLSPPPGRRCEAHKSALIAVFKATLPLEPPLGELLPQVVDRVYLDADWDDDTTISDGASPPSLRGLIEAFDEVFAEKGYTGDARNVAVAMRVRLERLLSGSVGRVVDTVESVDIEGLMRKPVVVELVHVSDAEDRALLAMLLLDRVRAAAEMRESSGGALRHVTVLEEAHLVLGKETTDRPGTAARESAREAFTNAIAELRAFGEGFIIATQTPVRLTEATLGVIGSRIVHRVESAAGRKVVLDDMATSETADGLVARLGQGEALAKWPPRQEASLLSVRPPAGVDTGRPIRLIVFEGGVRAARRRAG